MSTDFNETPGAARYRKSGGSTLGQMWKNPIFKLIAVVVVLGGAAMAGVQFMQKRTTTEETVLPVAQTAAPVSADNPEANTEYVRAVEQLDQTRAEEASARGESALPTPMANPVASPTLDSAYSSEDARDPLRDFESMINANQAQNVPPPVIASTTPVAPAVSAEAVQAMSQKYRAQMDMLMAQWNPGPMNTVQGTGNDDRASGYQDASATPAQANVNPEGRTIVSAGSVYYAQMLMEANSDVPGPIMAQILTGPLAGGKAIGSFETYRNHLMIRFNTVSLRGRQLKVDILALDPDTTLGGVATEVDPRYFSRVILPAAAEFVRAYGDTISEPSSTTTVTGSGSSSVTTNNQDGNDARDALYKGLGAAADRVGQFVDEEASATKRLVRVGVGTPLGLFFVSPVTEGQ